MGYNAVVVSGLPGAGKSTLLKKLSEKTGWRIHSIGDLFREKLKYLQETGQVGKELTIKEWRLTVSDKEQIRVNVDLLKLVNEGKIIADTRYAFYLKRATSNPLFVFLTTDAALRAHRESMNNPDYNGKTIKQVKEILMKRENDEINFGLRLFGKDYRNPEDYDLILDSGKMSAELEASRIMDYL